MMTDKRSPKPHNERCLKCMSVWTSRSFFTVVVVLTVVILTSCFFYTSQLTSITSMSKRIIRSDFMAVLTSMKHVSEMNGTFSYKTFKSESAMQKDYSSWLARNGVTKFNSGTTLNSTIRSTSRSPMDKFGNRVNGSVDLPRQQSCSGCFYHDFKYIIDNETICKLYQPHQYIQLLVLVLTVHAKRGQRDAIRDTWLSVARGNTGSIRYAFLLGKVSNRDLQMKVEEESRMFGDILQEDFVDAYANLTYKTIMAMKWMSTKCPAANFLLKIDDDMFANIPGIVKYVSNNEKTLQSAVAGSCALKAFPIRSKKSKWFASERSYPNKYYPGFCSGTGYVTSGTVARKIYEESPNVPFFHLEDVYVSLCIRKLGMKLIPVKGFHSDRPRADPCVYKSGSLLTSHRLSAPMLKDIWRKKCDRNPM